MTDNLSPSTAIDVEEAQEQAEVTRPEGDDDEENDDVEELVEEKECPEQHLVRACVKCQLRLSTDDSTAR
jgi:hypothetical protein